MVCFVGDGMGVVVVKVNVNDNKALSKGELNGLLEIELLELIS